MDLFLAEILPLGGKLGPLLIQLPPSLAFVEDRVVAFSELVRRRYGGGMVCEPRHPSWLSLPAGSGPARRMAGLDLSQATWCSRMYSSPYSAAEIGQIAAKMRPTAGHQTRNWRTFNNTMHGGGARNAIELATALR